MSSTESLRASKPLLSNRPRKARPRLYFVIAFYSVVVVIDLVIRYLGSGADLVLSKPGLRVGGQTTTSRQGDKPTHKVNLRVGIQKATSPQEA
eukprot:84186-Heterocapsa_arctica.AAC.1